MFDLIIDLTKRRVINWTTSDYILFESVVPGRAKLTLDSLQMTYEALDTMKFGVISSKESPVKFYYSSTKGDMHSELFRDMYLAIHRSAVPSEHGTIRDVDLLYNSTRDLQVGTYVGG